MEEYVLIELAKCPRCEAKAYEQLSTHSYCSNCNFSPTLDYEDHEVSVPRWAIAGLKSNSSSSTPTEPKALATSSSQQVA